MIYGVRHHRRPTCMLPSVDEMSGGQYGPLGAGRPPATTFHQQQQPRQIRVTTEVRCLGPGKLLIETSPASRRRGAARRHVTVVVVSPRRRCRLGPAAPSIRPVCMSFCPARSFSRLRRRRPSPLSINQRLPATAAAAVIFYLAVYRPAGRAVGTSR